MMNGKWKMDFELLVCGPLLTTVAFILFYPGKHPVEFTGRNLAAAEFADAGRVYF